MFKFEFVIKYKSLNSAWLGLAWFISQAKLKLNIKPKLKLNIMFLSLRSNTSILLSLYQVYNLAYLVWMSGLNLQLIKVLEGYEFVKLISILLLNS